MFENLRRDAARYAPLGGWYAQPGFWIVAVYRLGIWGQSLPSVLLRLPIRVLYRLARFPLRHIFNVDIWAGRHGARIGPGLCLIHPRNIIIAAGVEIGRDCLIFHEVTLGTGLDPGYPRIGDNVDIYVGARVLGGIVIGDRSMIGANCVVTQDVPARSVLVSPRGQVIPRALSPIASRADQRARAGAVAPDELENAQDRAANPRL